MMATKIHSAKKTLLTLSVLLASGISVSQAQADQLADIKAAGVVKVATFDANPPFGSVDAKRIRLSAMTSILPKRWPSPRVNWSWWPPIRPTVFRYYNPVKPT